MNRKGHIGSNASVPSYVVCASEAETSGAFEL